MPFSMLLCFQWIIELSWTILPFCMFLCLQCIIELSWTIVPFGMLFVSSMDHRVKHGQISFGYAFCVFNGS